MANITRNFIKGRMNKSVDERLIPDGEYVDAINVRMGSTEGSEIGVIENTKGNLLLAELRYNDIELVGARCIGAFEDGANETIYWFITSSTEPLTTSPTGKVDMIASYDTKTSIITYHVISVRDGVTNNTTLNFNDKYLITGVNIIEDLLFFTDNINPPRQINTKRNYPNPNANVDGVSAESLLVIKKPPTTSPTINSISNLSQENFLEDRLICFAYRYRYEDNEYSATSQFSAPSFKPGVFEYSPITTLNEGMLNSTNACEITYNSGGPLVKSVDLLFKDMNSPTIKVIERLNKADQGLADNTEYTYTFSNSKIFTILPDSEILRLYDNVPLLSQAQTLMGNRIIYGNYTERYDLINPYGEPTRLDYTTSLISQPIGLSDVTSTIDTANYSWDVPATSSGIFTIDLTDSKLIAGAVIDIDINFKWSSYSTDPNPPTDFQGDVSINFAYTLQEDFASVHALATSAHFLGRVGIPSNIQTIPLSCDGTTLTDFFNCIVDNDLATASGSVYKYKSGISAEAQPISVSSSTSSNIISFQIPAVLYVDDINTPIREIYTYYDITTVTAFFQELGNPTSLHSNRGYETAIVYMDDFNRATPSLVSENNTEHVNCSLSSSKNNIRVTIPTIQIAPAWATRYKFAIKPDKKDYDTVYTNFFFRDPSTGADFFLLEGQNSQKIEEGDELIVKRDSLGARNNCTWTTVLEKKAQASDFLNPPPVDAQGATIPVPAGVYMKLRANNFNTDVGDLPVVAPGAIEVETSGTNCNQVTYPLSVQDTAIPPQTWGAYTIPAGSRIKINIVNDRPGTSGSISVPRRYWAVDASFTSPKLYPSFYDWYIGESIASALKSQGNDEGTSVSAIFDLPVIPPCNPVELYINLFSNVNSTGQDVMQVISTQGKSGTVNVDKKKTRLKVEISVTRAINTIVFESDPADAEPDLWYESDESYPINLLGEHTGGGILQNQVLTTGTPAVIDTSFFNCYSFGNGVESYKIQDSLVGKDLTFGNRITTTSDIEYKEVTRYADLTYSGVYNEENNVNKLNQFNLGLLNFKSLEQSFGPVQKLFGRETDILTLQEDRISYVLQGKEMITGATGGSSLITVPEVLGKQVARIEDYGISSNPESFVQWGADKYFTDAKRGAVIQLKGSSAQNEQLKVISEQGMRSWFRDLFIDSFGTQKLGGFDPYMNEYVLSNNDISIPIIEDCINCGITQTFSTASSKVYNFCVDFGTLVGDVAIAYNIVGSVSDSFEVSSLWDGTSYSSGAQTTSGVLTFNKSKVSVETGDITLNITGSATIELTYACPDADTITIVLIQVNSNSDATGQYITNQYKWTDGTFQSPLHSQNVTFQTGTSPAVSSYETITGKQGGGVIPSDGTTVTMLSTKVGFDNYDFVIASDKFRYVRSNTLYSNTPTDIQSLLGITAVALPILAPINFNTSYSADFTMPSVGQYLYLVWDYRKSTSIDLCLGADLTTSCCDC